VEISDNILEKAMAKEFEEYIDRLLENTSFSPRGEWRLEKKFYATEAPKILYVEFAADIDCQDIADGGRTGAVLRVTGDGRYDVSNNLFSNLQPHELSVAYETTEGVREQSRSIFASAHSVIGHRIISNTIRERLSQ